VITTIGDLRNYTISEYTVYFISRVDIRTAIRRFPSLGLADLRWQR